MGETTTSIDKQETTKALDAYTREQFEKFYAEKMNDPKVAEKAAIQTKYNEAMGDALIGKGVTEMTSEMKKDALGKFASIVLRSNNDKEKAVAIAEKDYKDDKFITGCFKALTASTPSEGGFFVPEILSSIVIDTLNPNLVYTRLGSTRIDMPNGNIRIPRFDARAAASYIGEAGAAGSTKQTIGNIVGSSKKLAAIIPISNDLIRNANAGFSGWVQNSLVTTLKLKKDYTAMYGSGGANSPSGIKTQIPSSQKIGSSTTVFTADTPANLMSICMASDVPGLAYGWAFNAYHFNYLFNLKTTTGAYIYRDEMNQGKLLGYPFVISNQVYSDNLAAKTAPTTSNYGEMFFGDWSEFVEFVQLDMELMAFKEATFVDETGATVSCVQNDMTALRAICLHDFGLKHTESFAISMNKYSAT